MGLHRCLFNAYFVVVVFVAGLLLSVYLRICIGRAKAYDPQTAQRRTLKYTFSHSKANPAGTVVELIASVLCPQKKNGDTHTERDV